MAVIFFLFEAGVIPTQKEKKQEGEKLYRLWFIFDSNGTVTLHSAGVRVEQIKAAGYRSNFV